MHKKEKSPRASGEGVSGTPRYQGNSFYLIRFLLREMTRFASVRLTIQSNRLPVSHDRPAWCAQAKSPLQLHVLPGLLVAVGELPS